VLWLSDIGASAVAHLGRPRTLVGAAVLAVSAGIVANALLLQVRPHPSPFFLAREIELPDAEKPDELVRAVQDALKQVGYYSGPLDGIAGPQTRSAIQAFEVEIGREEVGEASLELLSAIRSANRPDLTPAATAEVHPAAQSAPASVPQKDEPDPAVAAIQDALARSAYGPLIADGVVGPDTREAIMRFQRDHNLPVIGDISDALVVELRATGALDSE
jgi:lysozyme family protein